MARQYIGTLKTNMSKENTNLEFTLKGNRWDNKQSFERNKAQWIIEQKA